ncbi:hypothetical protein AB0J74_37240 [Asanoa sp. NPDC049573]
MPSVMCVRASVAVTVPELTGAAAPAGPRWRVRAATAIRTPD